WPLPIKSNALRVSVDIEILATQKTHDRHLEPSRDLDREARWRRYGTDDGNLRHGGLLHNLEAGPARDEQNVVGQRRFSRQYHVTNDLIDRVMPAHIFSEQQQSPSHVEQA